MADRIVVMNKGHIEQVGTPEEIYRFPATPFVADFVGVMNFIPGVADSDPKRVRCGDILLTCDFPHNLAPGTPIALAVRPEDVRLGGDESNHLNTAAGRVREIEFLGSFYRLTLHREGLEEAELVTEISINRMRDLRIAVGATLHVYMPPGLLRVYPAEMMEALQ